LNYAGKFGSGGLDSHSNDQIDIDSLSHQGNADTVTIPDAHLLFSGDYQRSGTDLIVSDHDHRVVVPNYFHGDKRPMLVSPDGAPLDPKVIEALTGHVQYAQADGTAAAAKVVGHVIKMTGSASVVRNGVTVTLNEGDNVLQNDVVQTGSGSTLGLVMIDGTTFNLTAGARLMLNDLTYDANSTSNTSLFTLVQGAASFVAGQVAKTGDMKIGTPVATMGIRGTAGTFEISSTDGTVLFSVIDQRDGQVHSVQVFNNRGILIGTVTSNGSALTLTPTATFDVLADYKPKDAALLAQEFNVFQQVLNTYDAGRALFPNLPQHTDANPQSPTRYAGSPGLTSPATEYHSPNGIIPAGGHYDGPGTVVPIVLTSSSSTPTGSPAPTADPVFIPLQVVVPAAPLPFVVNPPPISRISTGGGDHFGPVMSADGQYIVYDPDGAISSTTAKPTPRSPSQHRATSPIAGRPSARTATTSSSRARTAPTRTSSSTTTILPIRRIISIRSSSWPAALPRSRATAASSSSSTAATASESTINRATRSSRSRRPRSAHRARSGGLRSAPTAI
jgi:hypothetical protein